MMFANYIINQNCNQSFLVNNNYIAKAFKCPFIYIFYSVFWQIFVKETEQLVNSIVQSGTLQLVTSVRLHYDTACYLATNLTKTAGSGYSPETGFRRKCSPDPKAASVTFSEFIALTSVQLNPVELIEFLVDSSFKRDSSSGSSAQVTEVFSRR